MFFFSISGAMSPYSLLPANQDAEGKLTQDQYLVSLETVNHYINSQAVTRKVADL